MDLHPDADAEALRTATAEWLADNLPWDIARRSDATRWQSLEEMGWADLTRAEADGGLGLDHPTEAMIYAELGRHLAPIALPASAVGRRWAAISGKLALALKADDATLRVFDPEGARQALVIDAGGLGVIPLETLEQRPTIDLSTHQARVASTEADAVRAPEGVLHLRLLLAAYAVGTAEAARDMAVDYAKIREQFGQPIGAFQAIKHFCADMAVACVVARSQLYYAACALQEAAADAAFHIASAELLASRAAIANGRLNIQIHGGIGITDEAHAPLPLKRAHLLEHLQRPFAAERATDF